jgi:hypothetical protein
VTDIVVCERCRAHLSPDRQPAEPQPGTPFVSRYTLDIGPALAHVSRHVERKPETPPEAARCHECDGRGTVAHFGGPRAKVVVNNCSACNGTGRTAVAEEWDMMPDHAKAAHCRQLRAERDRLAAQKSELLRAGQLRIRKLEAELETAHKKISDTFNQLGDLLEERTRERDTAIARAEKAEQETAQWKQHTSLAGERALLERAEKAESELDSARAEVESVTRELYAERERIGALMQPRPDWTEQDTVYLLLQLSYAARAEEKQQSRQELAAAIARAEKAEAARAEQKAWLAEIAAALHPHWVEQSRNGYLPDELAAKTRAIVAELAGTRQRLPK